MTGTLEKLESTIKARRGSDPSASYVASLFARGMPKIAQKLGEEAVETVIAALQGDPKALTGEAADLDNGTFTCTDPLCIPAAEPAGVTVAEDGRIFLVDTNNHRVLVYHPENRTYRTWAA